MAEFTQTIKVDCPPACGNGGVIKHGFHGGVQRYQCKGCRKVFRGGDKAQGRSYAAKTIGSAVDAFYDGLSYRRIAQNVGQAEGIDTPSSFTPYDWVKDYTALAQDLLDGDKPKTGDEWVVDEMAVDVGGRKVWLWNVMDADARFVLATPRRSCAKRSPRRATCPNKSRRIGCLRMGRRCSRSSGRTTSSASATTAYAPKSITT